VRNASTTPLSAPRRPQNHTGKRQDASQIRHDVSRRGTTTSGEGKPLRKCKRAACGKPFEPARPNQEYHCDDCRKRASFERKYIEPLAELRGVLENLLRHFDAGPADAPAPVATEFERDLAAARKLLGKD